MAWQPPSRKNWVAHLNVLGSNLADGGRSVVPLDADHMLDDARRATGLDDYGDDWFQEPYRVLVKSLEEEARLNLIGRIMARSEIARVLESRLRVEDELARHPEIEEQPVAPVHVVTGLGRSGTSLLHELFTLDPDNRVPMLWEMMYPVPPPETASFASDERIARADLEIRIMDEIVPAMRTMHELAGDLPNECIFLLAHQFASDMWIGRFHIPSYAIWMGTHDLRPAYAYHKRLLKLLQWHHPKPRWVLKAPSHLGRLPVLFETYPDARVVITHRDPLKVIASFANLVTSLKYMGSDAADYEAALAQFAFGYAYLCQHVTDERKAGKLPEDRIIDVLYADLMADPVAAVRGVYERWQIPFGGALAECVRAHLDARPKDRHGAHEYTFADTGLDLEKERLRYADYQEHFGVPSEVV
jgi:sulfotransferase family protein